MLRRGFTLIELLVVITILAILAGAALPYVQNYVAESRIAKAKTDLEEIARALAIYETREGEYTKLTVSDLTGRYLNKSPIDPWGSEYIVSPDNGIVYSKGPDRKNTITTTNEDDDFDNINVPYQPPLALVSAKWVDKNQSGAVDTQNVSDELHLTFSRKLGAVDITKFSENIFLGETKTLTTGTTPTVVGLAPSFGPEVVGASKVVVYKVSTTNAFTVGQDYLKVKEAHGEIFDVATPNKNYCLGNQKVYILPQ